MKSLNKNQEKVDRLLKKFLILTGASAVGIPVSFILHNLFYALFIKLYGAGFWDRIGIGDEPKHKIIYRHPFYDLF